MLVFLVFISIVGQYNAFYLPGIAPVLYCKNSAVGRSDNSKCETNIPLFVNALNSDASVIPYDYERFDFCPASDGETPPVENLGQVVFGQRIKPSPYEIKFLETVRCKKVCQKQYDLSTKYKKKQLEAILNIVKLNYEHHWIIDNMPLTWCNRIGKTPSDIYCQTGFPVGCHVPSKGEVRTSCLIDNRLREANTYYLFNHVHLNISYHKVEDENWGGEVNGDSGRIIAIRVTPHSIKHNPSDFGSSNCDNNVGSPMSIKLSDSGTVSVTYSYSITWTPTDLRWSSRWDYILDSKQQSSIQWFSILNSLIIVLFMSGMMGMIMLRTLHKDIARYNQIESGDDTQEEYGWKLVHGDVFRPPRRSILLSVVVGSGTQVLLMFVTTLIFACLGFLSPANRGYLMTCAMILYVCFGFPAGYISARLYKSFGGERWKSNVILTSMLCPGIVFFLFFVMNLVLWYKGSSASIPFSTLLALLSLWFLVSVPLTFVGAFFGFRKRVLENPVRTNKIPRQVPEQVFYTSPVPSILTGGVPPFGCIFIQLFFIFNSIWAHQTYYMFGFLFLVFLIQVITCSETVILLCYFHLCSEDYNWWWRSFLTGGSTAFYLFLYSVHYFVSILNIEGIASTILYFGYTFIIIFLTFLVCGCIGFFACFWFVRKIYSVVKVD